MADNSVGKTIEALLRHDLIIVGLCRPRNYADAGRTRLRAGPGQGGLLDPWLVSATGIVTGFDVNGDNHGSHGVPHRRRQRLVCLLSRGRTQDAPTILLLHGFPSSAHPERLDALIVQNAVAHEDGLGPLWKTRREFWADRETHEAALRENFFSYAATRQRHVGTSPNAQNYDPDLWTDELAFLSRPGQQDIQTDLFYDYRTNVASYPAWQDWLRKHQPPLQVVWGRYDPSFQVQEAEAYRRDVPDAEVHVIDAGHFALDEQPDLIADLTRRFLQRRQAHTDG